MTDLREIANTALRHVRTAPPHIRVRATQQWLAALAEAWLAEHPEDDGEAITYPWLGSIGWTIQHHSAAIAQPLGGSWLDWCGSMCLDDTPLPAVKTRGHVRRLMAALGIEAKGATP